MSSAADLRHMAHALGLAERGRASTDPNPSVGCVIVQGDTVVGEGFTQPAGGPHAEIVALAQAGARAEGATVYVTLEPCAHTGRTGPCTDALIAARVARVVYAVGDPNPLVAGNGARRLSEAGIAVETPLLAAEASAVNRGFFCRHRTGRPWIRCKMAASLDGRTALASGVSQWITGPDARRDVHRWRARSSAVMTGVATVLADDPALTARPDTDDLPLVQPKRIICDTELRTPPTARTLGRGGDVIVFAGQGAGTGAGAATDAGSGAGTGTGAGESAGAGSVADPALASRRDALERAGARIELVPATPRLDLEAVVARLAALEINTLWLEAGPTLAGAMLAAGLVDELVLYLAPSLLGDSARCLFELPALERLEDRIELAVDDVRAVGDDWRIVARVKRE